MNEVLGMAVQIVTDLIELNSDYSQYYYQNQRNPQGFPQQFLISNS